MSRNFFGFGQVKYIGVPFVRPITLEGRMGQVVPLMLNWLAYGASSANPNINVAVDLSPSLVALKLKQIRSIYIDNMGSDNPIYVYFPSTDYTVVAQPNSAGWFRAYANDFNLWVIGEGFVTGDIPTTKIIVANVDISPAIDIEIAQSIALWKASATISRGSTIYNQNFGVPALGDQTVNYADNPVGTGVVRNIWGTPYPSGFLYLTHINVVLIGIAAFQPVEWVIESTGSAGILYDFKYNANVVLTLVNFSSMNVKLDATQTWRIRVVASTTTINFAHSFNWSTNPT